MNKSNRLSLEVRERAVLVVSEHRGEYSSGEQRRESFECIKCIVTDEGD